MHVQYACVFLTYLQLIHMILANDVLEVDDVLVSESSQDLDLTHSALTISLMLKGSHLFDGHLFGSVGCGHAINGRDHHTIGTFSQKLQGVIPWTDLMKGRMIDIKQTKKRKMFVTTDWQAHLQGENARTKRMDWVFAWPFFFQFLIDQLKVFSSSVLADLAPGAVWAQM